MTTIKCKDCTFYVPIPLEVGNGECRRMPKQLASISRGGGMAGIQSMVIAAFPNMKETDWCGEFVRADTETKA